MKTLIIIRGPSGSGKSTIASSLLKDGGKIFETDQFWSLKGEYNFDPRKLGIAHKWNQINVATACNFDITPIIVSNTNMTMWEMKPYIEAANTNGYELKIIRTPGPWLPDIMLNRNIHDVPLKTLEKQINKYQTHEHESEWNDMSIFK